MALDLTRLPTALRQRGVRVVETDGWLTTGYNTVQFVGQMNHHTAVRGPCTPSTAAAMLRGRPDLPGPLCNAHGGLDHDGRFILYMIAGRRARHAGRGSSKVLAEVARDIAPSGDAAARGLTDDASVGNRSFFGWEWQHPGDGSPWAPELLAGIGVCNAVLATMVGWTSARSIHHREWTRRKIDMSWRGDLRALVVKNLEDDVLDPSDIKRIVDGVTENLRRLAQWDAGKENSVFKSSELDGAERPMKRSELEARFAALEAKIASIQGGAGGTTEFEGDIVLRPKS